MTKPLAVFLDKASLHPQDLDFSELQKLADWQWFDNARTKEAQSSLKQAEIIVSNKIVIDRGTIQICQHLKLICVAATGINNVDIVAARQHGVAVSNVRGYATTSVVQHVFSLMLALNQRLNFYQNAVAQGDWSDSDFFCYFGDPASSLEGKTLGIIGYGELGKAVAKMAQCFSMKVIIAQRDEADTRAGRVALSALLADADVVSLHCPLTKGNYHLLGEKELQLMKPDAVLLNTARGGLVDEQALLQALENNRIAGAALDVLEQEPPSATNPVCRYDANNLIVTPHIAWASQQSRQCLLDELSKNIMAYRQGQIRNSVFSV